MIFSLLASFLKIGAFTFGGGYAMIPLIEQEVITRRRWIDPEEFYDLLTIAQSAPGPISLNTAVFVGYKLKGYIGAAAALSGIVLPPFVIILLVAAFFADIRNNPVVDAAFKGMRPAVTALIIAPVIGFMRGMRLWAKGLAVAIGFAIWYFTLSPVPLLIAGAAAGVLHALLVSRKMSGR